MITLQDSVHSDKNRNFVSDITSDKGKIRILRSNDSVTCVLFDQSPSQVRFVSLPVKIQRLIKNNEI